MVLGRVHVEPVPCKLWSQSAVAGRPRWLARRLCRGARGRPGPSGRATLYTGARGSGKTVMLNAVEDRAKERGWLVNTEEQAGRYQAWFDNARRLREAITQLEATSLRTLQDTEGWQPKIRDN